jgi:PKD repeat protein
VSGVIAGIDWVTANHIPPAVANMSLAAMDLFLTGLALDQAVQRSIAAGVPYAVAAANDGFDACYYTPARVAEALTAGATDITDARAYFSNYGSCVDLFAPGVDITSAWKNSDTDTFTASGTSMAAPHVAGVAALYLEANPAATSGEVAAALLGATTKGIVQDALSSHADLLFSGFIEVQDPDPGNARPVATFEAGCTGLECTFTDESTDADGSVAAWDWDFGDGSTSTAQNPTHTYESGGSYTVTLIVHDDLGKASLPSSQPIDVTDPSNQAPVAAFQGSCAGLDCTFTDLSSDGDGSVVAWSWTFGDGATSSAQNPAHSYAAAGEYTVTLIATDDDGTSSGPVQQTVTATEPVALVLTASKISERGTRGVHLEWGPQMTVDIWRARLGVDLFPTMIESATTVTSYVDLLGKGNSLRGSTWAYFLCKTGDPEFCSNMVQVAF